jgi:Hsp70 protein
VTEPILAIDLGTATTSGALITGDEVRLLKEPASGLYSLPTSVAWDGQTLLVGTLAERRRRSNPALYLHGFVRDLGQTPEIVLGQRPYSPHELVAAILGALKAEAERLNGGEVGRLLLTVPAGHGPGSRTGDLMITGGAAAGFTDVELLPAPLAVTLDPASAARFAAGDHLLVCDAGGTAFRAALIRVQDGGGRELYVFGEASECGGASIDTLLIGSIRAVAAKWLEPMLTAAEPAGERSRLELAEFARRVKHQLSEADRVEDYLTPLTPPLYFARDRLEQLMRPLLKGVTVCCQDVLRRGGVSPAAIRRVLLMGGCARVPAVQQTIRRLTRDFHLLPDPELAVVRGAAEWARSAPTRRIAGDPPQALMRALAWQIPGGAGRLVNWLVAEGEPYRANEILARIRAADETVWELAADRPGTRRRQCAAVGHTVATGDVLAITRPRVTCPADLQDEPVRLYDVPGRLPVFGPSGRRMVTIGDSGVWAWDVASGNEVGSWDVKANINANTLSVGVKAGGHVLLAFYANYHVFLWDLANGTRPLARVRDFQGLHVSSDGMRVCTIEAKRVTVLDTNGRKLHRVGPEEGNLTFTRETVAISDDGQHLAIVSGRRLLIWNIITHNRLTFNLNMNTADVPSIYFAPDASALLLGANSQLVMIDLPSGNTRWSQQPQGQMRGAGFTSDGKLVATADVSLRRFAMSLRDAATGEEIRSINVKYQTEWVKFSPDGRFLAANEADRAAIWALIP